MAHGESVPSARCSSGSRGPQHWDFLEAGACGPPRFRAAPGAMARADAGATLGSAGAALSLSPAAGPPAP
eukprot:124428-Pyramimonas_sp.AAC.1